MRSITVTGLVTVALTAGLVTTAPLTAIGTPAVRTTSALTKSSGAVSQPQPKPSVATRAKKPKKVAGSVKSAKVIPVSATKVRLKWSKASNATRYSIRTGQDPQLTVGVKNFKLGKKRTRVLTLKRSTPGITFYYRIFAHRGKARGPYSRLRMLTLRATAPTNLRVSSSQQHGLALLWTRGSNAQSYQIQVSTNSKFTAGGATRIYTSQSQTGAFSPPNLTKGTSYHFRVRAVNLNSKSAWVRTSGRALSNYRSLMIGSLNAFRGSPELPLSDARIKLMADEIKRGKFDVVGLQETVADGANNEQTLYKILDNLDGLFEAPDGVSNANGHRIGGNHILYRTDKVVPDGAAGIVQLSNPGTAYRRAAYQVFKDLRSNARFLFVSTHLTPGKDAASAAWRRTQTNELFANVISKYGSGLPVIVTGDLNSYFHRLHPNDYPNQIFANHNMVDSLKAAQTRRRFEFNTVHALLTQPGKSGLHVDYIFASPGVVSDLGEVMVRLNGSKNLKPFVSDHWAIRAQLRLPY